MKNVSVKSCRGNQNTFYIHRFPPQKGAVNEIIWKNKAGPDRPQMTIRRMRIACWITKATDTLSEYVTLLFNGDSG
jgi:hypothetical protein